MGKVVIAIVSAACIALTPATGSASAARTRLDVFFRQATAIVMHARDVNSARAEVLALARPLFDSRAAAQDALGREWDARTPTERDEFAATFGRLLETAYLRMFEGLLPRDRPPDVRITGESPTGAAHAVVWTTIAAKNGSDVRVDYKMRDSGKLWLVNDVVVDGISVVQNYKAQFERVLRESGFDDLMTRLRAVADDATLVTGSPAPSPGMQHATLYFETDDATLTATARRDLDQLARALAADPRRRIVVEGFSDARGPRDRNARLAERRAGAVRSYLATAGIARDRVSVASSGARVSVCREATGACWAQNRRAVARIVD